MSELAGRQLPSPKMQRGGASDATPALTIPVFNRPEYADAALAGQAICRSHRNPGLWGGAMKHIQISEQIDVINPTALRHDVQRAVATAKIAEFENQAHRLGDVGSNAPLPA